MNGRNWSREQWLKGLARICLTDVRKMFDEHGNPIAITKLADCEAAAIAGFEVFSNTGSSEEPRGRSRTLRVRMVDQPKALELYGKAMAYSAERETGVVAAAPLAVTVNFVDPRPSAEADDALPTINLKPKFIP